MIAYQIEDGVIINVLALADGAIPGDIGAIVDPSIPTGAGIGYRLVAGTWVPPDPPSVALEDLRTIKFASVASTAGALLSAGAPHSGLHIAVDNGSRADLTAMAATATAALSGTVAWPESYARGWISIENARIPLATPADGLALAAVVGDWYARLVQHRRDLKDAVIAAADAAAVAAIDITAGWPA